MKFENIVKQVLDFLPKDDYPVLNSKKYFTIWLEYTLDQSVMSMRDVFGRLKIGDSSPDMSTFSKASQKREIEPIRKIYKYLNKLVSKKKGDNRSEVVPFDATTITLTSKLMWAQGYHQVKLFAGNGDKSKNITSELVVFGQSHDYNYGENLIDGLEGNQVGVFDRGFAGVSLINYSCQKNKKFVVRIKNNYKLKIDEEKGWITWDNAEVNEQCRVVNFCDLETKTEFRLATNLSDDRQDGFSNEEIGEIYKQRWGIELFWKFLKMHLKLDKLITKNINGIQTQIYMALIGYLILQLVETPKVFGNKPIEKLRYLQACMCHNISYVHWIEYILIS
jgi:putative transposase